MARAMTVQEMAEYIKTLNRRVDGHFVEASDWIELMKFLGKAFAVPDELLYADEPAEPCPTLTNKPD